MYSELLDFKRFMLDGASARTSSPWNVAGNLFRAGRGVVMIALGWVVGREPIPVDRAIA